MQRRSTITFLLILFALTVYPLNSQTRTNRPVSYSMNAVERARKGAATSNRELASALEKLKADAKKALNATPHSVMEKEQTPPSGSKHDYMSLARYYWPDSTKPNGLPYKSRDGIPNPEILTIPDATYCAEMINTVHTLALAYSIFGDESYAAHAAKLLRVWYLDTATCMNPNMQFAQGVKGIDFGRPAGLIETREMGHVCDAVVLLAGSKSWTNADNDGMYSWFKQYLQWLTTHRNAIAAAAFENNHSVWFGTQAGSIANFVGENETAKRILDTARVRTIDRQIEPDGSQPRELGRTISEHYVMFNLEGFFRLASVAEQAGVDFWHYETADGRSIRKALDWMIPYLSGEKTWTWKQIKPFNRAEMIPILIQASIVYREPAYRKLAEEINLKRSKEELNTLLFQ